MKRALSYLLCPPKLVAGRHRFGPMSSPRILDIGCGNYSPSLVKAWFPSCHYHGLDVQQYNLTEVDRSCMDQFTMIKSGQSYKDVLTERYDWIICNHVLEHMHDAYERLNELCQLLARDGLIYTAFPSIETLSMPSADGTLQFCDDSTHVFLPTVHDVANVFLRNDIKVLYGGRKFDPVRAFLALPTFTWQQCRRMLGLRMKATGLWAIYRFEASVVGIKSSS